MNNIKKYINQMHFQVINDNLKEILVPHDKFYEFIELIYENGYRVVDITWWKHRLLEDRSDDKESMGGVLDINDNSFYWAETIYTKSFDDANSKQTIMDYYNECCKNSDFILLLPSVFIKTF